MINLDSKHLILAVKEQLNSENNLIANLANISSLIFHSTTNLNWVGFYLVEGNDLVVGPFQGRPACVRIKRGHGVCGEALDKNTIMIVNDVLNHSNHIACDSNSRSEIVVPIYRGNEIVMVMDIDSELLNNFVDEAKNATFIEVARLITDKINKSEN